VYDDAYRDRRGSHTSFDIEVLPELLGALCREAGVTRLLDVSGGQGRLAETLVGLGIHALTTDITATSGLPIIPFDLSRYSETEVARVRQEAERVFAGAPHVTSCLDVLEHIDPEHVVAAVRNLAGLTKRLLVASISTRPSSRDNLFHASIFPLSTWIRVFDVAGFRLLPTDHFTPAAPQPRSDPGVADPLIDRWRVVDPFGDANDAEPCYLVFEKIKDIPDWAAARTEIEEILDVAYRREKRRQFSVPEDATFVLSLHHVQEYSFLRALLDVLPRDRVRVILRPHFLEEGHRRAITGFLTRTGVPTHVYERAENLPWSEMAGRIVVTAAESGCAANHIHGLQIAALARLHGCPTYLLQHGIWPRSFPGRIVTFGSELVLHWGVAEERILQRNEHRLGAADVPWGVFSPGQVRCIGSPRYTDQLLPIHPDGLNLRLGIDHNRFASVVLLASKKAYTRGGPDIDNAFHGAMLRLIERFPETLFLIRPHPGHGDEGLLALRRDNVRFLDETCFVTADIPMSRIIPLVDQVVAPISTVVLDGAISDKPVVVYDRAQPQTYDHIKVVPADQLPEFLGRSGFLAEAMHRTRLFRNAYAEGVDTRFYERFATLLSEPPPPAGPPDVSLALAVSLTAEVELQWSEARRARVEAAERIEKLETERAAACGEAAALAQETEALRSALETVQKQLRGTRLRAIGPIIKVVRLAVRAARRLMPRRLIH